jgi:Na+/H+-translocating membrane pyrophosphatase
MFALAALSVAPFVSSVATFGTVSDGARGTLAMINGDADAKRRVARLDDAGFLGGAVARRYAASSAASAALLVAWAIALQARPTAATPGLAGSSAALIWCGAIGAAVVLSYAGAVSRAAVRAARDVSAEVERQLRGFPREHGVAQVPLDYTPSYKSCVELTTTVALRHALWPVALGVGAPLALGGLLWLAFRELSPDLAPRGLSLFVAFAALTALCVALAFDALRATLGSVRRVNRGRDHGTAISADAVSDVFGNAAAPALLLAAEAAAAAALILTPFLR